MQQITCLLYVKNDYIIFRRGLSKYSLLSHFYINKIPFWKTKTSLKKTLI